MRLVLVHDVKFLLSAANELSLLEQNRIILFCPNHQSTALTQRVKFNNRTSLIFEYYMHNPVLGAVVFEPPVGRSFAYII